MAFKIRKLTDRPQLYMLDDFLTSRECSTLISMAKKKGLLKGVFAPGEKKLKDASSNAAFKNDHNKTILDIHKRIRELTHFPDEWGEATRVVLYKIGGEYLPHNDFFREKSDPAELRVAQMLFYLNDVEEGGETVFPNIGIKVIPKKGRALLWYNVRGMDLPTKKGEPVKIPARLQGDDFGIHYAEPVKKGEKWIAAKFMHTAPFPIKKTTVYK